jgi:hypothetical protein
MFYFVYMFRPLQGSGGILSATEVYRVHMHTTSPWGVHSWESRNGPISASREMGFNPGSLYGKGSDALARHEIAAV